MTHTAVSPKAAWYDSIVPPVVTSVTLTRQAGGPSYTVPTGSGDQLKTVPVGGANRIIIKFSEDVSVSGATVEIKSIVGGGSYPIGQSFTDARTLRIDFNSPIQHGGVPGDKVLITFGNIKRPGTTGASLDGDWTNPVSRSDPSTSISKYPSGDGTPGGSFQFRVIVLPGDFNGDNFVGVADYNIWHANQGTGTTYVQGDADGDGDVDNADYTVWLSTAGTNWPSW